MSLTNGMIIGGAKAETKLLLSHQILYTEFIVGRNSGSGMRRLRVRWWRSTSAGMKLLHAFGSLSLSSQRIGMTNGNLQATVSPCMLDLTFNTRCKVMSCGCMMPQFRSRVSYDAGTCGMPSSVHQINGGYLQGPYRGALCPTNDGLLTG